MSREKRQRILSRELDAPLPWSTDPALARRLYQRIYRDTLKNKTPEEAIAEHLGFRPRMKKR